MNEIELFVEMIDDNEANKILKYFNDSIPGIRKEAATIEQKRRHIKKVFQSRTKKMVKMKMKNKVDPFYSYINNYPSYKMKKSFKEEILLLKAYKSKIPAYVRFSIMILNFPNEIRADLSKVEENISKNLDPLDLYEFEDEEELKKFIRTNESIGKEKLNNIVTKILKDQTDTFNDNVVQCAKEFKGLTFLEFFEERESAPKLHDLHVKNIAYFLSHQDEDEDLLIILIFKALDSLLNTMNPVKYEGIENDKREAEKVIGDLKDKLNNKEADKNSYERNLKLLKKERRLLAQESNEYKSQIKELEAHVSDIEGDMELEKNDAEKKIQKLTDHYECKIDEKKDIIEILKVKELNWKDMFTHDFNSNKNWAVICSKKYDSIKELYPEVNIAYIEEQDRCIEVIKDKSVNDIYMVMNHLSTRKFRKLKELINEQEKSYKAEEFSNVKSFIEWIGHMNYIEKRSK